MTCPVWPANPTVGQTVQRGTVTYQWTGVVWDSITGPLSASSITGVTYGFPTVAAMVAATDIVAGMKLSTVVYSSTSNAGGAEYLFKTFAQADVDGDVYSPTSTVNIQCVNGVAVYSGTLISAAAIGFSVEDSSQSVTSLNEYIVSKLEALDDSLDGSFGLITSGITVNLEGVFSFSNELIIYPGVDYILPIGSVLKALVNGQTIVRSPTLAEYNTAITPNYFDKKATSLNGGGIIDGDNKASIGLLTDTVAAQSKIDVIVTRCTHSRYSGTCNGTAGSDQLTLSATTDVRDLDTIFIQGDEDLIYTILSLSGSVATLDRGLATTAANSNFNHRSVGASHHMAQQSDFRIYATANDIGELYSRNREGFASTDMTIKGINNRNNIALVECSLSGSNYEGKSVIQSFNRELLALSGSGTISRSLYVESLDDNAADTLIPPTGGAPITAAALRSNPMIDIKSGCSSREFNGIRWPSNPDTTTFRRLMNNSGLNTIVDGVSTNTVALNENPNRAGDFAPFQQYSTNGQLRVTDFRGPTNIASIYQGLVVTEAGAAPTSTRANWAVFFNAREYAIQRDNVYSSVTAAQISFELDVIGEAFSRVQFSPNGVKIGNGSSSATQIIGRQQGAVTDPSGGATIDVEARSQLIALLSRLRNHGLIAN